MGGKVGNKIINSQLPANNDSAVVLALSGDLGSGKTTFVQGFAKGLGVSSRIISPTFILLRQYDLSNSKKGKFFHIDLYRLDKNVGDELSNLGFREMVSDPSNIVAVEWAEKAKSVMPRNTYWLGLEGRDDNTRKISLPKSLM